MMDVDNVHNVQVGEMRVTDICKIKYLPDGQLFVKTDFSEDWRIFPPRRQELECFQGLRDLYRSNAQRPTSSSSPPPPPFPFIHKVRDENVRRFLTCGRTHSLIGFCEMFWERGSCLIGSWTLRKATYWLGSRLTSMLLASDATLLACAARVRSTNCCFTSVLSSILEKDNRKISPQNEDHGREAEDSRRARVCGRMGQLHPSRRVSTRRLASSKCAGSPERPLRFVARLIAEVQEHRSKMTRQFLLAYPFADWLREFMGTCLVSDLLPRAARGSLLAVSPLYRLSHLIIFYLSCIRDLYEEGAAVAEHLACSPPTKANRVQSSAGSHSDFCKRE
ncbi:hypothetical protein PR048_019889 [Dryococelus australis]|uniref:Uncharacterized protein n=1 Tax=Dryococelus australis TaxID=614101 RepID=A0ABQ9H4U8_9NEOP|nr:hypothetical protein PR048_019889 [Dryococelus australis]